MSSSEVISLLQKQYSGQMVLYVNDIAQVLGKSEKAIAHLISRKQLPFEIKMVGGSRCVDIFQVAHWLSSKAELKSTDLEMLPTAAPASLKVKSKRPKASAPDKLAEPASKEPLTGLMAAEILRSRHKFKAPMQRFVAGLRNPDEVAFMQEVQEKLFYSTNLLTSSYVVSIRKLAPLGYKLQCEETIKSFGSEDQACDFLADRLSRYRRTKSRHVLHFVLTHTGATLCHVVITAGDWTFLNNAIELRLSGM
jgi:predicted DNA-binding transcriptional regulator AlpA